MMPGLAAREPATVEPETSMPLVCKRRSKWYYKAVPAAWRPLRVSLRW